MAQGSEGGRLPDMPRHTRHAPLGLRVAEAPSHTSQRECARGISRISARPQY